MSPATVYSAPATSPRQIYEARGEAAGARGDALAGRSRRLSWARLAVALVVVFLLLRLLLEASAPPAWLFLGLGVAVAAFVALALVHGRVLARQARAATRLALQEEGLARLDRRWVGLPPSPPPPPEAWLANGNLRPVVRDLGLFGLVSLARLLGTAATPAGRRELGRWLLDPADPATLRRRQPAVAELAADLELRQELELAGRLARSSGESSPTTVPRPPVAVAADSTAGDPTSEDTLTSTPGLDTFLAWAEGEPWLLKRPGLVWVSRLLPLLTLGLGVAALGGLIPGSLAALPPIAALILTWSQRDATERVFERVDAGPTELVTYAAALAAVTGHSFQTAALVDISRRLTSEGTAAAHWMKRLARRVESADARHGSFHIINQVLTLWDFHALWALERWQVSAGRDVRRWLEALAELEALAALGTLAWENPDWCFPEIVDGETPPVLAGRDLGHPLLADGVRVGNDVQVGPPGRVLLVTGSNMSGKSTLLRALGANVTLGQAGGPVCAAALSLPPLILGTSILVEDSLADGVSFFYAELLRLKQVVDLADANRGEESDSGSDGRRSLLYLLDEVLRGTNSRERRVAVVRVLAHLLDAGAIGALSTHDLELGAVPEIVRAAEPVHFRETLRPPGGDGPAMTFDYQLRPGPATTTNALALLAAVGLDPEGGEPSEPR